MKCQKCSHQNEGNAKFCSACGEKLSEHVVQTGVPIWMWIVLIVSCITIGGVGYGFWDYYTDEKSGRDYKEVGTDSQSIQQTAVAPQEERQEQYAGEVDRVTLIKEVQQKVFTVLTSYGHHTFFLTLDYYLT